MKFAKLIELENNQQVLLTIHYDDSEDTYELSIRTDIDGIEATITVGFDTEGKAEKMMDSFGEKEAVAFVSDMNKMLCNPKG